MGYSKLIAAGVSVPRARLELDAKLSFSVSTSALLRCCNCSWGHGQHFAQASLFVTLAEEMAKRFPVLQSFAFLFRGALLQHVSAQRSRRQLER